MNYNEMLGTGDPGVNDPTGMGPGYTAMQQPMPDLNAARRPAANPQELGDRMNLWSQIAYKFQSDPNLQRSLMLTGAMLMQPKQPGQTNAGNIANAAVVGTNAYQMGQAADFERQAKLGEEARKNAELGIHQGDAAIRQQKAPGEIAATAAGTAGTQAKTTETLLDIETKQKTQDSTVRKGQALADEAVAKVKDFSDSEGLRRADRALKEQEVRVKASIPDEIKQQAALDEINTLRAKLDQVKAQTGATTAAGRLQGAQAATIELTNEIFGKLPKEQQEMLVASKFSGHNMNSGFAQQEAIHRKIYKALPDTDSSKAGMTEDQYVANQLKAGKAGDLAKQLKDYISAMDTANKEPDPDIIRSFNDAIASGIASRTGKASGATPAPTPSTAPAKKIRNAAEYNALPKGTRYIDPTGKERIKQ